MAKENPLQVGRQPIGGLALAETKHLLAQRDDVGQVLAAQRPQAPRPRLYCAVGDRASGQASWRDRKKHTSELQSRFDLVCRLLLEKKKKKIIKSSQHKHYY